MQTDMFPYEFLVRWDRTGRLSGAHAQFRHVTMDADGAVVGEFVGMAEPVAVAEGAGFPLSDILSRVQADALLACEAMRAERDSAVAERNALEARLAALPAPAGEIDSP